MHLCDSPCPQPLSSFNPFSNITRGSFSKGVLTTPASAFRQSAHLPAATEGFWRLAPPSETPRAAAVPGRLCTTTATSWLPRTSCLCRSLELRQECPCHPLPVFPHLEPSFRRPHLRDGLSSQLSLTSPGRGPAAGPPMCDHSDLHKNRPSWEGCLTPTRVPGTHTNAFHTIGTQ